MTMPKISVISVVFNDVDGIRRTLESVSQQDYGRLEYVVLDGASTDGTREFLENSKDSIDILVSEEDDGIYDAMNKGVRLASGDWVLFMNSGDVFVSPSTLSQFIKYGEDCDFLFGDRYKTEVDGVKRYEKAGPLEDTFKREVVFHQALLTKRSLLLHKPYDTSYELAADYQYIVSAFVAGKKFEYAPIPVCDFQAGGRSRQRSLKAMTEAYKVVLDHEPDASAWRDNEFLKGLVLNNIEYYLNSELRDYLVEFCGHLRLLRNGGRLISLGSNPRSLRLDRVLSKFVRPLKHIEIFEDSELKAIEQPEHPKVSIVSVVLNDKEGLSRTLESIGSLDYRNREVIVIDGASVDGSSELAASKKHIVDILVSEPDSGIYDAMNKGVDKATGEFIIFMNAGDEFVSDDVLSRVFGSPELYSGYDVVYGDRHYVDQAGNEVYQEASPIETIHKRMPFGHQSAFIRTRLIKDCPYNTTYRCASDYHLFVTYYLESRSFGYVPFAVSRFYGGGASEGGLLPYLEVLKIQIDAFESEGKISESHYLSAFRNNVSKMLGAIQ